MSEELKPCPFGLGYPVLKTAPNKKWHLSVCYHYENVRGVAYVFGSFNTREEAIKRWNTRTDNALIDTLVEVLEDIIDIATGQAEGTYETIAEKAILVIPKYQQK